MAIAQATLDRLAARQEAIVRERQEREAVRAQMVAERRAYCAERDAAEAAERAAEIATTQSVVTPENRRNRPATDAQRSYLRRLGVSITDQTEPNLTVARASELIDAAKNECLESIGGHYAGTVDAHD